VGEKGTVVINRGRPMLVSPGLLTAPWLVCVVRCPWTGLCPAQEQRLPSFTVAAPRSRLRRYKCRARDWLPCIKHATWLGFCHLLSGIFAFGTTLIGVAAALFAYVLLA
jgi:hypothetical protein